MKISDIEKKINASYNTIKKFIESNSEYNYKEKNIIHATKLGLQELEAKYGVRSEILTDDNVDFYKSQLMFLKQQLEDNREYSDFFVKQLEVRNDDLKEKDNRIKELEKILQQNEIEKLELKHELELEKNKSIWQKIFKKGRK